MRMAELSRESGVPVATIKYYLREGLLPPGERTSPNQARYGDGHVRRLKLVRALLDVGGLSIASVRDVLDAIDSGVHTHDTLGIAQRRIPLPTAQADDETRGWATAVVARIAAERGWKVTPGSPVVESLIGTLCTFASLGRTELVDRISDYADLAERTAEVDLDSVRGMSTMESVVEGAVVGTVIGDAMLMTLRRLAQQQVSARRFPRTG